MVTKVAGGIIGLGLISTGGIAMAKPHWLGMDYMPKWHSLAEDNELTSNANNYTSKFGSKYKNYLVGSTHKKDKSQETNQAWWEWSFRRLSRATTKSEKFKSVTNGYGTNNTKDLNKVCEEAYKADSTDVDDTGASNKFKKEDVWKYCSPGKLTTTSEDKGENKYAEIKIGGTTDNVSKLVSVKDSANDWFWEIRNKDFWSTDSDWSGSKATGESDKKSIFKTEYDDNSSKDKKQTIKDLCRQAYEKNKETTGTDNNNTDALKFCVLEVA